MDVKRCNNCNSYYDADADSVCPHCSGSSANGNSDSIEKRGRERKKIPWLKKKTDYKENTVTDHSIEEMVVEYKKDDFSYEKRESETLKKETDQKSVYDKDKTIDFWNVKSDMPETENDIKDNINESKFTDEYSDKSVKDEDIIGEEKATSLLDEVKRVSANSDGKTMSYFSSVTSNIESGSNVSFAEPVVGWLVCIKGNHFGESFNLISGKNTIGRNSDNRIVLSKDNRVSRENHSLIIYEPKKRNFYLKPGDGSGLTYLNGDYIDSSVILKFYDEIEIGDGVYLFVPLCNDRFSWEEYIKE